MAGLRVIHPGTHSTVQDRGRFGYRHLGVPVDGPFDEVSHALANALVGNDDDAATVEMTLYGGVYQAECPLALALAGAEMTATVVGRRQPLPVPGAFALVRGDCLRIGGCAAGARTYLAVRGGFSTERILGSRSRSSPLSPGELLAAAPSRTLSHRLAVDPGPDSGRIRLLDGPDARACRLEDWVGSTWRVDPLCDRVGVRLQGEVSVPVTLQSDRRSVPVTPGTVQIAGGRPVILGPACGTMGGYPIAALIIAADVARIGQLRPGDAVAFELVTLAEARRFYATRRDELRTLCDLLRRRVGE